MERMMWANGLWNTLRTHNYIKQEEDNRLAILFLFISSSVMNSSTRGTPHYHVYSASAHEWCSWLQ